MSGSRASLFTRLSSSSSLSTSNFFRTRAQSPCPNLSNQFFSFPRPRARAPFSPAARRGPRQAPAPPPESAPAPPRRDSPRPSAFHACAKSPAHARSLRPDRAPRTHHHRPPDHHPHRPQTLALNVSEQCLQPAARPPLHISGKAGRRRRQGSGAQNRRHTSILRIRGWQNVLRVG